MHCSYILKAKKKKRKYIHRGLPWLSKNKRNRKNMCEYKQKHKRSITSHAQSLRRYMNTFIGWFFFSLFCSCSVFVFASHTIFHNFFSLNIFHIIFIIHFRSMPVVIVHFGCWFSLWPRSTLLNCVCKKPQRALSNAMRKKNWHSLF